MSDRRARTNTSAADYGDIAMKRVSEKQSEAKQMLKRLRKLSPIHREIMLRVLKGMKEVEIAEELDLHPASVSRIVQDVLFQAEMNRLIENTEKSMQDLRREVADIGVDALVSLSRLLKDEKVSAKVRFQIAKEVLDRAGLRGR
jgi:hypothetical protein